jgi:hypothetical protein
MKKLPKEITVALQQVLTYMFEHDEWIIQANLHDTNYAMLIGIIERG